MCGIAGVVRQEGNVRADLGALVLRMVRALRHRGPDDAGQVLLDAAGTATCLGDTDTPDAVWQSDWRWAPRAGAVAEAMPVLALGHRRLSILDLSAAGHQPMCSADGRLWIVFNGEIYNYIELRAELETQGVAFRTGTDTEVLLEAFRFWGKNCLHKLNGMWAFALYDTRSNELWCSRDRTGVKPFYFARPEGLFAFASEPKALLALPQMPRRLNLSAVADYFLFSRLDQEVEGLFEGIFELPTGHELTICPGTAAAPDIRAWYAPPPPAPLGIWRADTFLAHVEAVRDALDKAVRLRLRADVPVGACLSGGLDSSTLVCLMHQQLAEQQKNALDLHVFTACSDDAAFDERAWAAMVVAQTGARWHQVTPDADGLRHDLETLMYAQDAPTFSSRSYAQFRVMRLVHEAGVKVVLDGQGGDELFSGYEPHDVGFSLDLLRRGRLGALWREARGGRGFSAQLNFTGRTWAKNVLFPRFPPSVRMALLRRVYPEWEFLNPELLRIGQQRLGELAEAPVGSLAGMLGHEFFRGPLQHLLRCEDRAGMWHSVESRTPFADDPALIEQVFAIPSVYKIRAGLRKNLLREAMRGILPEAIRLRRDKMGFMAPNNAWLRALAPVAEAYFEGEDDRVFNRKALLSPKGKTFWSPEVSAENFRSYKYLAFAAWRKRFDVL